MKNDFNRRCQSPLRRCGEKLREKKNNGLKRIPFEFDLRRIVWGDANGKADVQMASSVNGLVCAEIVCRVSFKRFGSNIKINPFCLIKSIEDGVSVCEHTSVHSPRHIVRKWNITFFSSLRHQTLVVCCRARMQPATVSMHFGDRQTDRRCRHFGRMCVCVCVSVIFLD